jgi:threonine-phosphate decarboxylase
MDLPCIEEAKVSAPYLHGGDIEGAARQAGVRPDLILDFSSNFNPMGLPPRAAETLAREAQDPRTWTRYPDRYSTELRSALNRYADVPSESIVIGAGADSLIHAAVRALAPRRCLIPIPAFSEYERAVRAFGCEMTLLPLAAEFRLPAEFSQLLRAGDLLILNNPHNPSGAVASRSEMLDHMAAARASGAAVLADEAFIDYVPDAAITQHAATTGGVVSVRSLTKLFGCPGLRVGYAVAAPDIMRRIVAQLPPWPITTLAANALAEALRDTDYPMYAREQNRRAREGLCAALSALGCRVFPGAANFLLVRVPAGCDAVQVRHALLRDHAMLVRECDSFSGLEPGRYLRVAVRSADENQRLIDALSQVLRENSCPETRS